MLERAAALTNDPSIEYRQRSIENMQLEQLEGGPFEMVVSSLTLHYVEDYGAAVRGLRIS